MMGKRFFYIPMGGLILITVIVFVIFVYAIESVIKQEAITRLKAGLNESMTIIKSDAPPIDIESFDQYLDTHFSDINERRLTIIDKSGLILADTALTYAEITKSQNYAKMEEIEIALKSGVGISTRFSATKKERTIYIAKPIIFDNFEGVIRISVPYSIISQISYKLETLVAFLLTLILIFMFILGQRVSSQMRILWRQRNAQLGQHVEDRTRDIELLQRLANMLAACNSINEAQQVVQDIIPRVLGDLNGSVSLMQSSRNQLEIKLDWGGEWPGAKTFFPVECWALRKGKFHLSNDQYTTLPCSHMSDVGSDQTMCIPLIAHGNTIGLMHLYMHNEKVTEELKQLAFTIGEHLGLALANLNLQEKLRDQAVRDPLTGLHNRRYLEEVIDHEFMRSKRYKQPLSLLMLDMDHFKLFNDNFGHDAGDYVLKSLGSLLNNSVRGEDVVCRVGGEELAILLPNSSPSAAIEVANKLCDKVRELHMEFNGQSLGKLTLSIGISTYPIDAENYEVLMKKADTALYEAKDNGRDRALYCNPESIEVLDKSPTISVV